MSQEVFPDTDSERHYPVPLFRPPQQPPRRKKKNNKNPRQRRSEKSRREMCEAQQGVRIPQEVQLGELEGRGSSFLSNRSYDPEECLENELQNRKDVSACWEWIKKRGYGQVHGLGRSCKVTFLAEKPWTDNLAQSLKREARALFEEPDFDFDLGPDGSFYDSRWKTEAPTTRIASTTFSFIAIKKVSTYLNESQVAQAIETIGNGEFRRYAQELVRKGVDSETAYDLTETELQDELKIRDRVHLRRIMKELRKFQPLYNVLVVSAQLSLEQKSWLRRLWLATFSPVPSENNLSTHCEEVLKDMIRRKMAWRPNNLDLPAPENQVHEPHETIPHAAAEAAQPASAD